MSTHERAVGSYFSTKLHCMVDKENRRDVMYERVFNVDQFIGKEVWLNDAEMYWRRLYPFLVSLTEEYWLVRADLMHRAYQVGCEKELNTILIDLNFSRGAKASLVPSRPYEIYEAYDDLFQIVYLSEDEITSETEAVEKVKSDQKDADLFYETLGIEDEDDDADTQPCDYDIDCCEEDEKNEEEFIE